MFGSAKLAACTPPRTKGWTGNITASAAYSGQIVQILLRVTHCQRDGPEKSGRSRLFSKHSFSLSAALTVSASPAAVVRCSRMWQNKTVACLFTFFHSLFSFTFSYRADYHKLLIHMLHSLIHSLIQSYIYLSITLNRIRNVSVSLQLIVNFWFEATSKQISILLNTLNVMYTMHIMYNLIAWNIEKKFL